MFFEIPSLFSLKIQDQQTLKQKKIENTVFGLALDVFPHSPARTQWLSWFLLW